MLADLDAQLSEAALQVAHWERWQRRLDGLAAEEQATAATVAQLHEQATREETDVARLEGASLSGLFYGLLGTREDRLRRERQEALAARLKHDEAAQRLTALRAEAERARQEQQRLADARARYQALLAQKEEQIRQTPRGRALFQLGEAEQQLQWQVRQIEEALTAGQAADAALAQVEDSLGSAQNWGVWDMLGGGLLATAVKHSRVDDARSEAHAAQQALASFRRELKDVDVNFDAAGIGIDGFARFADYFFDSLIVDWVVQNRISESLTAVQRTRSQVSSLLEGLRRRLPETREDLAEAGRRRREFIAGFKE